MRRSPASTWKRRVHPSYLWGVAVRAAQGARIVPGVDGEGAKLAVRTLVPWLVPGSCPEELNRPMRRPTSQELDRVIVDTAALLFARHGYSHTSVQQVADAVGYSKTGLLHRFPSKERLRRAVAEDVVAELDAIAEAVGVLAAGAGRDLAVVRALADLTLRRRGVTALMVSALTSRESREDLAWMDGVLAGLFRALGVAMPGDDDLAARVRLYGALGALSVAALATTDLPQEQVRDLLVRTAFDALGHPRP